MGATHNNTKQSKCCLFVFSASNHRYVPVMLLMFVFFPPPSENLNSHGALVGTESRARYLRCIGLFRAQCSRRRTAVRQASRFGQRGGFSAQRPVGIHSDTPCSLFALPPQTRCCWNVPPLRLSLYWISDTRSLSAHWLPCILLCCFWRRLMYLLSHPVCLKAVFFGLFCFFI